MALKDLPKYKDIRNSIRRSGRYPYVGTAVKDTIVIHHSLTGMKLAGSTPYGFANTHIDTNGWHGCAYPFVITWDGTIYQTDDLDRRTYHAGDTNTRSIGICVAGDFRKGKEKPTQAQMDSLYLLVKELQKTLPKLKRILGHQECPGYAWKNCPGDNWSYKDVVKGLYYKNSNSNTAKPTAPKQPSKLPETYTIQQGDTFWSIAKELEGITVDEIKALNPGIDPTKLKVGMKIKLIKTPSKSTTYTVRKGDTLWGIARAYKGVEVADIKKANNLKSDLITVGQKLTIPSGESSAPKKESDKKPATPSYVGKRVESIYGGSEGLNFYAKPSWDKKDIAGKIKKGYGFPQIVKKVKVGDSYQYQVKNSKGSTYYITASAKYVKVI